MLYLHFIKSKAGLLTFILIFLGSALCNAQISNEEKIAADVQPVVGIDSKSPQRLANPYIPDTSQMDFSFLKKAIGNKRIVILGESSHQDGTTFKLKIQMINYLRENMNFNTVLFECGNLYDSYLLNHTLRRTKESDEMIKNYGMIAVLLSMWSNAKEVLPLDSLILSGKLKYVGMDCQPNYITPCLITSLKNYVDSTKGNLFSEKEWKSLDSNIQQTFMRYGGNKDTVDYTKIKKQLIKISNFIKSRKPVLNSRGDILIQCTKNVIAYLSELNATIYESPGFISKLGSGPLPKSVNIIRDGQMADNVKWYLDRHPGEKIIIWTASFHGCKNLGGIRYRPNDTSTYKIDKVMGEYLNKIYGNDIYSIAFTSYEYAEKYYTTIMDTTHTSMEYYLYKTGINYGFSNFDSVRLKYAKTPLFKSIILGYNLKEGDWLNAFDGVFYVRRQEMSQQEPFHH